MRNHPSVLRPSNTSTGTGCVPARRLLLFGAAIGTLVLMSVSESLAQRGGPAETWWVAKTRGGVYNPPMRPIWRKADLLRMHAGQNTWSEPIIRDPEQEATYNSGAPGTKYGPRMHPDTPTVFVVIQGQLHFNVEGQQPVTATRGAIVNIMKSTVFSFDVTGDSNALWVEVNPANYKTVYPSAEPQPTAPTSSQIVKVAFSHTPAPYTGSNRLMVNTFDDYIAKCQTGAAVVDDHIWSSPLLGYVNAADNKCGSANGNIGSGPIPPGAPDFDPASTFGHMHAGPAEWWIVQVGQIRGQFENTGEFHAVEGDVLYAAPMTWHQMAAEAPTGPNVRLAFGGYQLINMNSNAVR
jgi:mannose-6-phosphate isomerase-like protein (cupin superfamily)